MRCCASVERLCRDRADPAPPGSRRSRSYNVIAIPPALREHAAFAPYRDNSDLAPVGLVPNFVAPPVRSISAIDFERRVVEQNELIVRPNSLHDLMNALVWLTFPKTKRAISEAHVALGVTQDGKTRPRRRDVLTLFDESGIIILSENDALRTMNQQHQWRDLFVTHRTDFIQQAHPILFGHGAMEQLGDQLPQVHRGLTVKALWLPLPVTTTLAQLDEYLAQRIVSGERLNEHERSIPMPVLGLPGWFAENEVPGCYDDASVFRPLRPKHSSPDVITNVIITSPFAKPRPHPCKP